MWYLSKIRHARMVCTTSLKTSSVTSYYKTTSSVSMPESPLSSLPRFRTFLLDMIHKCIASMAWMVGFWEHKSAMTNAMLMLRAIFFPAVTQISPPTNVCCLVTLARCIEYHQQLHCTMGRNKENVFLLLYCSPVLCTVVMVTKNIQKVWAATVLGVNRCLSH